MRKLLIIILLLTASWPIQAQEDRLRKSLTGYTDFSWRTEARDSVFWGAELGATVSSGQLAPFHLWANRGYMSPEPCCGTLSVKAGKKYQNHRRWMDYSFNVQPMMSVSGNGCRVWLREGYAAGRLYVFELTAGMRHSDNYGYYTADADLSSGGMLFSQNAMPIPRVSIATAGYIPFPLLFGYLEVKGGLTHGWLGSSGYVEKTMMHHKYLGARIGGSLPVNLSYEFHHAAQWGGISPEYGPLGSSFRDYLNTFLARGGGVMSNDIINAQGNHLCSQVIGLDFRYGSWKASAYWQTISEDGPIDLPWNALNARDGLWGLALGNSSFPYISGVLYEFMNTTNQAGAFHDRDGVVYGGCDSYFSNGIYRNGWTYRGYTIGHPLIISPVALPGGTYPYINRMRAHHGGIKGDILGYRYRALMTYTRVYDGYERPTDIYNHAFMIEVSRHFKSLWGLEFRLSFAMDKGTLSGNSCGVMFTVSKTGLL